jgi:hypothetical protein
MAKKTKTKPARRYEVVSYLGNYAVRVLAEARIIAFCNRRSDALLITKALNKT